MAYALTQSLNLVKASSQYTSRTDTYGLTSWQALTEECWVKPASQPTAGGTIEISTIGWANIGVRLRYWDNAGATTLSVFRHAWFTDTTFLNYATTLSTGTYYHIAYSKDASGNVVLYINGTSVASGNVGSGTGTGVSASSTVGAGYNNGTLGQFPWDGNISLHRVWSVVRTQAEISANMCNVFGTATTNMRAEHSFDNVYTDSSGNAYTLTSSGTPTFVSSVPSTCSPITFIPRTTFVV